MFCSVQVEFLKLALPLYMNIFLFPSFIKNKNISWKLKSSGGYHLWLNKAKYMYLVLSKMYASPTFTGSSL